MKDLTVVLDPHDPDGLQLQLRRRLVNAISRGVLCPAGACLRRAGIGRRTVAVIDY